MSYSILLHVSFEFISKKMGSIVALENFWDSMSTEDSV